MKQTSLLCDVCKQPANRATTLGIHHLQLADRQARYGSPFDVCEKCAETMTVKELAALCFPPLPKKPKPSAARTAAKVPAAADSEKSETQTTT